MPDNHPEQTFALSDLWREVQGPHSGRVLISAPDPSRTLSSKLELDAFPENFRIRASLATRMDSAFLYYLKFTAGYRAICVLGAAVLGLALGALGHDMTSLPYRYLIFDVIFSIIMVPVIFPAGWKLVAIHAFASAAWILAAWRVIGMAS